MAGSNVVIALVSLVISITAFIVAVAQALQQYVSSATGFRRCSKPVMGLWSSRTRRKFRLLELRFEVVFETPVFFLGPPENDRGPIAGRPIYNVDGTRSSYELTLTQNPEDAEADRRAARREEDEKPSNVHTADDETASWVTLLSTLQKCERESRAWDRKLSMTAKGWKYDVPQHSFIAQLQGRRRNWDYMPDTVLKPYATTTISHVAQIAATLGMIWKAFDADSWILRAEGNGLILTSSFVQGFGVAVSFAVTGATIFEAERIIPCIMVRHLVFGTVPTMFPGDDLKQFLNFGDAQAICRTLKFLKCDRETIIRYTSGRREHVRSVSFEIVAMIGQVARLHGSNFRMIPNPTPDVWNKTHSACNLMRAFQMNVAELAKQPLPSEQILRIQRSIQTLQDSSWKHEDWLIDIDMREAIHSALDSCTEFLLKETSAASVLHVVGAHISVVLNKLADPTSSLSSGDCEAEADFVDYYFDEVRPRVVESEPSRRVTVDSPATNTDATQREAIWVTLQYRMYCWFLLHDFDEEDTVKVPARLKGSRLPVYIL